MINTDLPGGSKEKLLRTTIELLRYKGFEATSVQEILDAAQVTKSNFYYHFKSKEALCLMALDYLGQQYYDMFLKDTLANPALSPKNRLKSLFEKLAEQQEACQYRWGCPFVNIATETSSFYPSFRQKVQSFFQKSQQLLQACYQEGMDCGEFRTDIDPSQIAQLLQACMNGTMVLTKVSQQSDIIRTNVEIFFHLIEHPQTAH